MTSLIRSDGHLVMVTGASSGIGRQTAILLSQLGARVLLTGRDQTRLEETMSHLEGQGHKSYPFDMLQIEQIPSWLKEIAASEGPLNGLAHCAGVHHMAPVNSLQAKKLEQILQINVNSAAMLARAIRQNQCHAPNSNIVFLSSVSGLVGTSCAAIYSASKAAIIGLTRSLALEFAPVRIRVNCIAAGMVRSEMTKRIEGCLTPEQFQAIEAQHPLGFGCPNDIACGVAYLMSDMACWVTGSTLVIDGGYTAQ